MMSYDEDSDWLTTWNASPSLVEKGTNRNLREIFPKVTHYTTNKAQEIEYDFSEVMQSFLKFSFLQKNEIKTITKVLGVTSAI